MSNTGAQELPGEKTDVIESPEIRRYRALSRPWRQAIAVTTIACIVLALNQLLNLQFFAGVVLIETRYLFLLIALLLPFVFVLFPAHANAPHDRVPWYDIVLCLLSLAAFLEYAWFAEQMADEAWQFSPPSFAIPVTILVWALLLEAVRRAGGGAIFAVVVVISLYPLYANSMPFPFKGLNFTFFNTAAYHSFSEESLLGVPMKAFASIVMGFLVFGAALQHTGAGKFFMDFAFALLGHVRGGPAKVAIFSSGLLGSVSGSVTTNILTTGALTIPAMKRLGFSARYAGGVEACASTGGVLMPPIMGATAFVMATFLNVDYIDVAIAAAIPSLLYFFGLFVAIDAYSARRGLKGMPKEELPDLKRAILDGWQYIFVFAFLIYMLAILQEEILAPYIATVALIGINQIRKHSRWSMSDLYAFIQTTGILFIELIGILAGIGLVVGALIMTGMAGTFTNDMIVLAGNNGFILLLAGAFASFILGMGLTITAAYILLAVVLAPGLVKLGFDPMAVHLFLMYWGMLSFITPPVAVGAYVAASLAKTDGMGTGFEAMRLGAIIYFIPFFFVLNPALIFHGAWSEIFFVTITAVIGVVLIAASLQGYLIGIGSLAGGALSWLARLFLLAGGFLFALPGGRHTGIPQLELTIAAIVVAGAGAGLAWLHCRRVAQPAVAQ
ncbi:MAG: TRAP transporter permease [Beijerinckiaceae bacterium]